MSRHDTGLRLYNTATRRIEPLTTADPGFLRMYVCGPTTYAWSHIGHARSYVVYDVLKRAVAARGVRVCHAQNFTDMEEAIARRAKEEGLPPFQLARKYEIAYLEDMASLRVIPADHYQRASVTVPVMVDLVQRLVDRGLAYVVDCEPRGRCDVYFDTSRHARFGHLIGQKLEAISVDAPVRGDRKSPADFALWKAHDDWGVTFASPWGDGRPGWHVECAAMATQVLGPHLDLHGGGLDLVFPHHESEAAIAESLHEAPYAQHWMHNGFVTIGRDKMSKSKGNYLTIRDALAAHPAEGLRRWLLSGPWRHPLEYDPALVAPHVKAAELGADVARRLAARAGAAIAAPTPEAQAAAQAVDAALADDLRMHDALAAADRFVEETSGRLSALSPAEAAGALATLRHVGTSLGILWVATSS